MNLPNLFAGALLACATATAVDPAPPALVSVAPAEVLDQEAGLVLDQQRWVAGTRTGLAWRVRVPLPGAADVVPSPSVQPFAALMPTDPGPWAAINGGFYERSTSMGLVISEGAVHTALGPRGGSGVFEVVDGQPRVVHRDAWRPGATEAVQSVDRLIDGSESLVKARPGAPLAARSAVVVGSHHLWLVVLAEDPSIVGAPDLRSGSVQLAGTSGRGLSLAEFASYLVQTTAPVAALNLDGAISTQLAVRLKGRLYTVLGEAGTINALVIRPPGP